MAKTVKALPTNQISIRGTEPLGSAKPRWTLPHYLALIGVPILVWEVWTLTAWLADGPRQLTEFRDPDSLNWYLARGYEALSILVAIIMMVYLVRGCRRERTILTFDVMFVACGATLFWLDAGANFFQPVIIFSSNFVNLNNACGHMPFVANPDCGQVVDPLLFTIPLESFGLLLASIGIGAVIRRIRERWPGISTAKQLVLIVILAVVVDLALELPLIAAGLWTYTVPGIPLGDFKYAYLEFIGGTAFFVLASLRIFKDDHGHTILERGLEAVRPRRRKLITFLAMYAVFQLLADFIGNAVILGGPYRGVEEDARLRAERRLRRPGNHRALATAPAPEVPATGCPAGSRTCQRRGAIEGASRLGGDRGRTHGGHRGLVWHPRARPGARRRGERSGLGSHRRRGGRACTGGRRNPEWG